MSPQLAKKFIDSCNEYFIKSKDLRKKRSIQWAASWLYLSCPSAIIASSRRNISIYKEETSPEDLHTIGLCWCEDKDLTKFFVTLEKVFLLRRKGINNWLRACRNIVRFRDHALKPEIVSKGSLDNILMGIFRTLKDEIDGLNFKFTFNNCILSLLYLLKRRRYEEDFLSSESELSEKIDYTLNDLITKRHRLSDRQYNIVSTTLKFLRKEANYSDLQHIMIEE